MVYLIDTNTNELDEVRCKGVRCEIIRHNFKALEKKHPTIVVTDREEVTYCVCDYISFEDFKLRKLKPKDKVIPGSPLLTKEEIENI